MYSILAYKAIVKRSGGIKRCEANNPFLHTRMATIHMGVNPTHNLDHKPLYVTVASGSKRHYINIMCVNPTSIRPRIDAHDVNMMLF